MPEKKEKEPPVDKFAGVKKMHRVYQIQKRVPKQSDLAAKAKKKAKKKAADSPPDEKGDDSKLGKPPPDKPKGRDKAK